MGLKTQTHLHWRSILELELQENKLSGSVSFLCLGALLWLEVLAGSFLSAVSAMIYSLEMDYEAWEWITFGVGCNPHTLA